MSQAFVREGDEQSLQDISPTLTALIRYLTLQNNGIRVYEKKRENPEERGAIHTMSDGLRYSNADGIWKVIE